MSQLSRAERAALSENSMTGEELKLMRRRAGLTRIELAQSMGLPGNTPQRLKERIYDFESGRRNILSHTEVLIRKILKKKTKQEPI